MRDVPHDRTPGEPVPSPSKVPAGSWLRSYRVEFYWVVAERNGNLSWTSQPIAHEIESQDPGGNINSGPITRRPAPNQQVTAQLA